jgi:hypothetical protein
MKWFSVFLITLCFVLPQTSRAADRACLIEGEFSFLGQTIYSKDCMQSTPNESEAAFKVACEALANTSAQLGGTPGKIKYMDKCPRPTQGICKGFMKSGRDAYYYARSASDLSELPSSCKMSGGAWSSAE